MQKSEKSHTDSARDSVLTRAVSWEHAFLDFIVNWVNDPTSERSLILFGQAGTGKSSIAYEAMRSHVFDKMHHLPEGTAQTGGLSLLYGSRSPLSFVQNCAQRGRKEKHNPSSRHSFL